MELAIVDQTKEIDVKAKDLREIALRPIKTEEEYAAARNYLSDIKALKDEVKASYAEQKELAHKAHKAVIAAEKKYLDPLEETEKLFKTNCTAYFNEQERIRKEAERKADEDAKKKAEEERAALEALGLDEAAKEVKEEVIQAPDVPKVEGTFTTTWHFEIPDKALVPLEYMVPDMVKIGAVVRALKETVSFPWARVWSERKMVNR